MELPWECFEENPCSWELDEVPQKDLDGVSTGIELDLVGGLGMSVRSVYAVNRKIDIVILQALIHIR